jgi:hypothetical protein
MRCIEIGSYKSRVLIYVGRSDGRKNRRTELLNTVFVIG